MKVYGRNMLDVQHAAVGGIKTPTDPKTHRKREEKHCKEKNVMCVLYFRIDFQLAQMFCVTPALVVVRREEGGQNKNLQISRKSF